MRGASAVPTWKPMPSVPALVPTAKPGSPFETGRGRNCATPSSPSANTAPECRTTIATAHNIVEKRRMSEPPCAVASGSSRTTRSDMYRPISSSSVQRRLLTDHVRRRPLVLGADELDQLGVGHDFLIQA